MMGNEITDLVIFGGGGLGREMVLLIEHINARSGQWNLIGFYDDDQSKTTMDGLPNLGSSYTLVNEQRPLAVLVAVANPLIRSKIVTLLKTNPVLSYPVFIHPTAIAGSANNVFRAGTVISAGVIITTGVRFDEFVFINLACTIGHDVSLGRYTSIMPGCNVSGAVTTGEKVFIGTGAKILQGIHVGTEARIGAGAVVTRNVPERATFVGIPATQLHDKRI